MLRKVAVTPPAMRVDAGTAVLLLQQAVRDQASVMMGYVDPAGVATQRVVSPISVRGGQLVAFDPGIRPGAGVRRSSRHVSGVGATPIE